MDLIQVRECCFISMKKITLTQKIYWLIMHCIKSKGKHVTLLIYLNGTSNTTSTEDPGLNIRLSLGYQLLYHWLSSKWGVWVRTQNRGPVSQLSERCHENVKKKAELYFGKLENSKLEKYLKYTKYCKIPLKQSP